MRGDIICESFVYWILRPIRMKEAYLNQRAIPNVSNTLHRVVRELPTGTDMCVKR